MFNYETWKLTNSQYLELGPYYESMCMDWKEKEGFWCDLYIDGEQVCQMFVSVYSAYTTEAIGSDPTMRQTLKKQYTTVGNAWMIFQVNGVKTEVHADGSGFQVEQDGRIGIFGSGASPILPFEDVQRWY